jgi:menaquinone-9 beta-reductase
MFHHESLEAHEARCLSDESLSPQWDAIVIGAGPAGSIVARELARLGKQVLLVDKAAFPRSKVCGGCLNAAGMATLERIGLGDLPGRIGAQPLDALSIYCSGMRSQLGLTGNVAVARDLFDMALTCAAVTAGATFRDRTEARPDVLAEDCRWLQLTMGGCHHRVAAKIVIVAAGLSGWREDDAKAKRRLVANSRIGAGTVLPMSSDDFKSGVVDMSVGQGGYVGIVRLADGRLDLAAAFDKRFVAEVGGPAQAATQILREAGAPVPSRLDEATWHGTPALTHRLPHVALPRTFVVGDAAGYVEPFTGEGMAWAMQAACEVAPLAARAIEAYSPSLGVEWEARHRRLLSRRMIVCGMVGRLLRYPRLARLATTVLARAPWLVTPLVRSINRPSYNRQYQPEALARY